MPLWADSASTLRRWHRQAVDRWPVPARLVMFCMVGATGMIVDLGTVAAVMSGLGLWFGWARIAGFATAVTWNFLLDDRITFATRQNEANRHTRPVRYLLFVATCSVGMVLNWFVSTGLYEGFAFFREHFLLAAAAGVVAGTASNFSGAMWVVFRRKDDSAA